MKYLLVTTLAALFSLMTIAQADDLSDRKALMKSINGYMKILRGQKNSFSGDVVANEANNIILAFEKAQKLFSEKGTGETAALDNIWSDADGFTKAFANGIAAAKNLKSVGDKQDESLFGDGFNQLAQSCGGCHRNYRARR